MCENVFIPASFLIDGYRIQMGIEFYVGSNLPSAFFIVIKIYIFSAPKDNLEKCLLNY